MRWVTARQPRKPSFRWNPGRSCTNIQTGPLNGGPAILASKFREQDHKTTNPAFEFGLFGALGIHFANYYYSAVAKIELEGPLGSWIFDNPTHALLVNAKELGASPLKAVPPLFDVFYQVMGDGVVVANALTFVSQALSILALVATAALPLLLVSYDFWHFTVFATTGIFFWKWIVVNVGFFVAVRRFPGRPAISARFSGVVLCLVAPTAFHTFPAGWYDTFKLNRLNVFAETDKARVRVPPAVFLHYSFGITSATFWSPSVFEVLYPTNTYGTTYSLRRAVESKYCSPVAQPAEKPGAVTQKVAPLVQGLHADMLSHSDSDGHPNMLRYMAYPHHIVTNPLVFTDFWSLDIRRVKAYVFEVEPICTAAQAAAASHKLTLRSTINVE